MDDTYIQAINRARSVPLLSEADVAAIRAIALEHPWAAREEKQPDKRSPYHWVRDFYGHWMGKGLMAHHLMADESLYATLMQRLSRARRGKGRKPPEWFELPIDKSMETLAKTPEEEQLRRVIVREELARLKRESRARLKARQVLKHMPN